MALPPINNQTSNVTTVETTTNVEEVASVETPTTPVADAKPDLGTLRQAPANLGNFRGNTPFNANDNGGLDAALNQFAEANADNPQALSALRLTASTVAGDVSKFVAPDGTINRQAFSDVLMKNFATIAKVTVPPLSLAQQETSLRQTGGGAPVSQEESLRQTGGASGGGQRMVIDNTNKPVYKNLTGFAADADVMAMAIIVILEAAKSAREDLKAIMDGVKAINKEKEGWRSVQQMVNNLNSSQVGGNMSDPIDTTKFNQAVNKNKGDEIGQVRTNKTSGGETTVTINTPGPDGSVTKDGLTISAKNKQGIADAKETVKNKLDSLSEMGEMESLRLQMAMDRLSKLMSTISNLIKKSSETNQGITQNIK
jgi:hypothetical protein